MPTSLQVQSFDHLTLVVADLVATRHFYVDLLGLPEIARPDFDFGGLWFRVGNVQLHAIVAGDLAGQAGWGDRSVVRPSRGHHFALRVADVETAVVQAKELGIEIAAEFKHRPGGVTLLVGSTKRIIAIHCCSARIQR